MKKTILLLLFMTMINNVISQNLVPNYSFEEFYDCPGNQGQFYVDYWFVTPDSGYSSPEYYNDCSIVDTHSDVPENITGFQYPFEGEGYAGIFCYGNDSGQREYIETHLSAPLLENQEYEFSMYVSLPEKFGLGINNLGALFTNYLVEGNGTGEPYLIEANPQVKTDDIITDKDNWTQITGTFIAEGGEEYLTIGNFFSDEETETISVFPHDFPSWSYYYIDSVSLTPVILNTEDNELENQLSVYPNPISDSFTVELATHQSNISVKLYNVMGKLLLQRNIENQLLKIDISDLSTGVYLLEITDTKGNRVIKRLSKL